MTTTSRPNDLRVCLFEVADQGFGIPLEAVREIVPMAALSRPPSMPPILEGFLNLRGTAVPVLRLAGLFGLPPVRLDLHTPLIILRTESLPLALLVDRVEGIASFPADSLLPMAAPDSFNGCVASRITAPDDRVFHVLSPARLLLGKEHQILAHAQAMEATRLRQIHQEVS